MPLRNANRLLATGIFDNAADVNATGKGRRICTILGLGPFVVLAQRLDADFDHGESFDGLLRGFDFCDQGKNILKYFVVMYDT